MTIREDGMSLQVRILYLQRYKNKPLLYDNWEPKYPNMLIKKIL